MAVATPVGWLFLLAAFLKRLSGEGQQQQPAQQPAQKPAQQPAQQPAAQTQTQPTPSPTKPAQTTPTGARSGPSWPGQQGDPVIQTTADTHTPATSPTVVGWRRRW